MAWIVGHLTSPQTDKSMIKTIHIQDLKVGQIVRLDSSWQVRLTGKIESRETSKDSITTITGTQLDGRYAGEKFEKSSLQSEEFRLA